MTMKLLWITSATLWTGELLAQQSPAYHQTLNCIKVLPGKGGEYREFVNDASKKIAQARADAGEIFSWTLLRAVIPAGDEAKCDYLISTLSEGPPPAPAGRDELGKRLQKAGIKMTAAAFLAKRDSLTRLVSTELWRVQVRVGQPQKGHYVYLNHMKVHNAAEYAKFESDIWRPLAEQWVKDGDQSGWIFATKLLPSGTDVNYRAYSADIYPTWDAVFKTRTMPATFAKAHSGKDFRETMQRIPKLRDLARRELLVIEERLAKQ